MKKLWIIIAALTITNCSFSQDTTAMKYFPLNVGNRWTWYRITLTAPGPGYEVMRIINAGLINSHFYYKYLFNSYLNNGGLYYTTLGFYRIDSLTGNLLQYDSATNVECVLDSLRSQTNDSTRTCGSRWFKCSVGTYPIFSQNPPAKSFGFSNYFESGGGHTYAMNFGKVYAYTIVPSVISTWRLYGCIINGVLSGDTTLYLGVNKISTDVPQSFSLSQNFPNPFNPNTKIKFQIAKLGNAMLTIYDALGREVTTLVNEQLQPGTYEAEWDASNYPSGIYFYKLESTGFSQTKKLVLIK